MSYRTKTGFGFIFVGIAFFIVCILFVHLSQPKLRKQCTATVEATIIGYDELRGMNGVLRGDKSMDAYEGETPIFEYEYNGEIYQSQSDIYDGAGTAIRALLKAYPDGVYLIKIDPNNPKKIYVEEMAKTTRTGAVVLAVVGSLVILLGIITIFDKKGVIVKVI